MNSQIHLSPRVPNQAPRRVPKLEEIQAISFSHKPAAHSANRKTGDDTTLFQES